MGLGDLLGAGRPDAREEIVDVDVRGLGLLLVVDLRNDHDCLDDHDSSGSASTTSDTSATCSASTTSTTSTTSISGSGSSIRRTSSKSAGRPISPSGTDDKLLEYIKGKPWSLSWEHEVARGLRLVLDQWQAGIARRFDLGLESSAVAAGSISTPRAARRLQLLGCLERAFQLVRRFVERAPHDLVGLEQPFASALRRSSCTRAVLRLRDRSSSTRERTSNASSTIAPFGARRFQHPFGVSCSRCASALDLLARLLRRRFAGIQQLDDGRFRLLLRDGQRASAVARMASAASSASFVRRPRIDSASLFIRVASSCASRSRRATLSSPLALISVAASRREEHPHGLLTQRGRELHFVGMRGGLGPRLRGLELGPQRGLAVAGLAQLTGDVLEEDPYVIGVVAAKTRRERRTRDGIGTEARRTTLGVAIGRHCVDRMTGHPPGGRPPSRPPSRSFTFLTIPSTNGEPVGGTRVVVGGVVGGVVVVVGPPVWVVDVVVGPTPVVGAAVVAVAGGCAASANWNWVALSASWMAESSGSLATP